jgi:hypothetical protein
VDTDYVYWTDFGSGSVMKVPIDGGASVTIASGQPCPAGIAVDSTSVYWANRGPSNGTGTVNTISKR